MRQFSKTVLCILSVSLIFQATCVAAKALRLVANPLPTLVSEESESARLNELISSAFEEIGIEVELIVDRPAFSGSGLLTGKYDGEFAHLALQEPRDKLLYSKAYLPALLFIASRKYSLDDVTQFSHIRNSRIATTNRIANTPAMRDVKSVSWVRNPTLFDMFSQLSQKRADYVFEDWLVLAEFNRLLAEDGEQPLYISPLPLVSSAMTISLRKDFPGAKQILAEFDSYINRIQKNGKFNQQMGVSWTLKDINDDGVADWITTSTMPPMNIVPISQKEALPLDKTQPGQSSVFVVDGEIYNSWTDIQIRLKLEQQPRSPRTSLLDREIYKQMLQRW